jgi:hypothetical protein
VITLAMYVRHLHKQGITAAIDGPDKQRPVNPWRGHGPEHERRRQLWNTRLKKAAKKGRAG